MEEIMLMIANVKTALCVDGQWCVDGLRGIIAHFQRMRLARVLSDAVCELAIGRLA